MITPPSRFLPLPFPHPNESFHFAAKVEGGGSVNLQQVLVKAKYNLYWTQLHTHHPHTKHGNTTACAFELPLHHLQHPSPQW